MQNGTPINIPLTVNLHIEKFSGGTITQVESGSTNCVYDQYEDGRWFVTQRPGVNMFSDASAQSVGSRGRGIYYWDAVSARYIVNTATVYKTDYAGSTMSITNGTGRVYMNEVGSYLTIIDPENDEGWYISSAASTTITQIASNFPSTLARGAVELNGKLYVMTPDADIYESDIEDPTTWGALNFRNAEVEADKGVYLEKHHEHVVAFGTRTCEFFYDNANTTGSTLEPRTDIHYNVGMVNADAAWKIEDDLYFVGQDSSGSIGVYVLSNFQMIKVSKEDLDTFLTTAIVADGASVTCCGMVSGGRVFFTLTVHYTITDLSPTVTLVYTSLRQWWGFWDVQLTGVDYYPLVSWTPSSTTRAGEGILTTGDLVTMLDDFNPVDTLDAFGVFESGVFEADVFTSTGGAGTNIPITVITGVTDGGTAKRKRQGDLWLVHTPTETSEDITISTADEQNATYTSNGTIDVSDSDARLNRMGSFRRRNFKLTGSLSDQVRLEKIQTTVRAG